ncbi:hypothetical protein [Nocardia transvalensis]|uniref:hypothetical protein n=1 Tax=Nocardia transvalensis TaxID=37333 RepID=UPI001893A69D|nr:hypothetical protein [Nocardia transvalensis]MBF6330412.1 hypothetical protein [Nocardia transvalensis]
MTIPSDRTLKPRSDVERYLDSAGTATSKPGSDVIADRTTNRFIETRAAAIELPDQHSFEDC